jgi:L-amino acid N-acyltransferase YncA
MIIRKAQPADTQSILDIYIPFIKDSPATFETKIPSLPDFQERIDQIQMKMPWIVAEINGEVIGYAYSSDHRKRDCYKWTKELSVYLLPQAKGKGIAVRLYDELINQLKSDGVNIALAGITMSQEQSIKFHEKYGFKKIGVYHSVGFKNERWHDVGWWELKIGGDKNPT